MALSVAAYRRTFVIVSCFCSTGESWAEDPLWPFQAYKAMAVWLTVLYTAKVLKASCGVLASD